MRLKRIEILAISRINPVSGNKKTISCQIELIKTSGLNQLKNNRFSMPELSHVQVIKTISN